MSHEIGPFTKAHVKERYIISYHGWGQFNLPTAQKQVSLSGSHLHPTNQLAYIFVDRPSPLAITRSKFLDKFTDPYSE